MGWNLFGNSNGKRTNNRGKAGAPTGNGKAPSGRRRRSDMTVEDMVDDKVKRALARRASHENDDLMDLLLAKRLGIDSAYLGTEKSSEGSGLPKELKEMIAPAVMGIVSAFAMPHLNRGQLAPAQMPALPAPDITPAPAPAPPPPPSEPVIPPIPEGEVYVSFASRFIINNLDGKTPEDAAGWILQQSHPQIQEIVQQLPRVPDQHLPRFVDLMAEQAPDLLGLAEWLKRQPAFLTGLAAELRRRSGA